MRKIVLFVLIGALVACEVPVPGGRVSWRNDTISRSGINDVVVLIYPVAEGGAAADRINATVTDYLKTTLAGEDPGSAGSLESSIDTLLARKNRDTLIARIPYQLHSEGSVYNRGALTSVWLQTYTFTGGAHGMTLGKMFNFDNRDGRQLTSDELFTDTLRFKELNRAAFQRFLKNDRPGVSGNDLFVGMDTLPLPENVGFDSTGVVMLYNPYEIAPYVFGQSVYEIPYETAAPLLQKITQRK